MPRRSRRVVVRAPASCCATSTPAMRIDPPNPPSSRPTACNKVDLPEPEGPRSATISPSAIAKSIPRSTSIVSPPWLNARVRPVVARTASFIAQDLYRIGARRFERRVERREEGQKQRDRDDSDDLYRVGLRRELGQEPDRRIPQILPRHPLHQLDHALAEIA